MIKLLILAIAIMFAWVGTAQANVTPLWAPMQLAAGANPSASALKRFKVVVGTHRLSVPSWRYQKATRSPVSTWPESWYVHQNGVRVRDAIFHHYVMNPYKRGWQRQVAKACPHHCFLDGTGISAISRTTPKLHWTQAYWIAGLVSELKAIRATGDIIVPNSVNRTSLALVRAAGHRGSTEGFNGLQDLGIITAGRIWVIEHGNCGYKLASFLIARGRGDLFTCFPLGANPTKVLAPMKAPSIGAALSRRVATAGGFRRRFQGGTVRANTNGTYTLP